VSGRPGTADFTPAHLGLLSRNLDPPPAWPSTAMLVYLNKTVVRKTEDRGHWREATRVALSAPAPGSFELEMVDPLSFK